MPRDLFSPTSRGPLSRLAARLHDPLSSAMLPLANGLLRRLILGAGARPAERRLCGVTINSYAAPPLRKRELNAPPIVLVHGIADSAATWAYLLPLLRALGPVYALDLPGFGLSRCPPGRTCMNVGELSDVLAAFIEEVVGRRALVVGNSLGGWVAVRLAGRRADLLRGLVLLDPGGAPLGGRPSWQPFIDTVAVPDLRAVRQIYRQMFGRVPLPLYLGQRGFQALFSRSAVQGFIAATTEEDFLSPEELRGLQVPAALVWGQADRFLPDGSLAFFREQLPGAPAMLLRGCGHLPQQERPVQVALFIRRFTRSLAAAAPR